MGPPPISIIFMGGKFRCQLAHLMWIGEALTPLDIKGGEGNSPSPEMGLEMVSPNGGATGGLSKGEIKGALFGENICPTCGGSPFLQGGTYHT